MARASVWFVLATALIAALVGVPAAAQDSAVPGIDNPQTIRDTFVAGTSGNAAIFRVTNSTGQRVTGVSMTPSFPLQWIDLAGVTPRAAELEVGESVDFTIEFAVYDEAPDGATETVTLFFDANEDVDIDNPRFQLIVDIVVEDGAGGLVGSVGDDPVGSAGDRTGGDEDVAETDDDGGSGAAGRRAALEDSRAALESCDFAAIRRAEVELAAGDAGFDAPALAMLEKLRHEIAADDSFEEVGTAYAAGALDAANGHLAVANATNCAERQAQIADGLDKIARLRDALVKVDSAIAACELGPLRRYDEKLDGRGHVLLVEAKARVGAVTGPLIQAIAANDAAEATYLNGDLGAAESNLGEARRSLDGIGPNACPALRQTIAGRLDKIGRMRDALVKIDSAIAACDVAEMGLLRQAFAENRHPLLVDAGRRLAAARPAAIESRRLHEESEPLYQSGAFATAEPRLRGAQAALRQSGLPSLCPDLRDRIGARLEKIAELVGVLAAVDQAIDGCDLPAIEGMQSRLAGQRLGLLADASERLANAEANCAAQAAESSLSKESGPTGGETRQTNCAGVLGNWAWPRGTTATLSGTPNGGNANVVGHQLISAGSWSCIGPEKIRITWNNGTYVDTMTLSGDTLSGSNQTGWRFSASRLTQSEPAGGETCEWRAGDMIFPSACVCKDGPADPARCGR